MIVTGGKGTGKSELGEAIVSVSFNAVVVGQASAASVVRLMDEARVLIVLDDLESLGRALKDHSFSDISQMLKLSYKKKTGRKAITDKGGKTRVFDFYGPKVVNNTRGVDAILGSRMIHIPTRRMPDFQPGVAALKGDDPEEPARLRDELHAWGMANACRVHDGYRELMACRRERDDEIAAPLRAIAALSGDPRVSEALEKTFARQAADPAGARDPLQVLREAVGNCIKSGATEQLSGAQLMLELRLIAGRQNNDEGTEGKVRWESPLWVGQQLRGLGALDVRKKVSRRRLYGVVTRIYHLSGNYADTNAMNEPGRPRARAPLAFCEEMTCERCPYQAVCESTIAGLMYAKLLNRRLSGRKSNMAYQATAGRRPDQPANCETGDAEDTCL